MVAGRHGRDRLEHGRLEHRRLGWSVDLPIAVDVDRRGEQIGVTGVGDQAGDPNAPAVGDGAQQPVAALVHDAGQAARDDEQHDQHAER